MSRFFLVAVLLMLVAPSGAAQPRSPVLIELFTSEGCSDCPAADLLLQKLLEGQPVAGAEIIPLALHVDSWDHQGWKDPFASKANTARHQAYIKALGGERVQTPQLIVDGRDALAGGDERAALGAVDKAIARTRLPLTIDARLAGTVVRLSLDLPAAPKDSEPIDVLVALTEDGLTSTVRRGENSGRTLSHVAVTRRLQTMGALDQDSFVANGQFPLDSTWKPAKMRAVAFLQGRTSKQVFGAATSVLAK